jgi:hypothetical protein
MDPDGSIPGRPSGYGENGRQPKDGCKEVSVPQGFILVAGCDPSVGAECKPMFLSVAHIVSYQDAPDEGWRFRPHGPRRHGEEPIPVVEIKIHGGGVILCGYVTTGEIAELINDATFGEEEEEVDW